MIHRALTLLMLGIAGAAFVVFSVAALGEPVPAQIVVDCPGLAANWKRT